jgi:DNA polymerase-3 subunit epsilon
MKSQTPPKILIIDIETTGFLQTGGKIVEIGMVELDLSNGEREIVFDRVCHEDGITNEEIVTSWIVSNSTLKSSDIRFSTNLKNMFDDVQNVINMYPDGATAFNNVFDFGFLENRGFKFPKKLACPMILSTDIVKMPSPRGFGYKWPKVPEAYQFFFGDTGYEEAHRGADDAMHEAEIVFELYQRGIFKV